MHVCDKLVLLHKWWEGPNDAKEQKKNDVLENRKVVYWLRKEAIENGIKMSKCLTEACSHLVIQLLQSVKFCYFWLRWQMLMTDKERKHAGYTAQHLWNIKEITGLE